MWWDWNHLKMNFVFKRKPLDERLYNRDLEAAVTLSLLNNSSDRLEQAKGNGLYNMQLSVVE